jgi:hypothetical protein
MHLSYMYIIRTHLQHKITYYKFYEQIVRSEQRTHRRVDVSVGLATSGKETWNLGMLGQYANI